jgi:5-methylcytosine-specific restriction protein B
MSNMKNFIQETVDLMKENHKAKLKDLSEDIINKFKDNYKNFKIFTDSLIDKSKISIDQSKHGNWQHSGVVMPYLWNRYSLEKNIYSSLVLGISINVKGLNFNLDLNRSKNNAYENITEDKILKFLQDQAQTISNKHDKYFELLIIDKRFHLYLKKEFIDSNDTSGCEDLIKDLYELYKICINKFYNNYQEIEFCNWAVTGGKLKENTLSIYHDAIKRIYTNLIMNELYSSDDKSNIQSIFDTTSIEQITSVSNNVDKFGKSILTEDNYKHLKQALNKYQDFLSNNSIAPNYWVFQGSPKIYNIVDALKSGHVKSWKVAAHKDKIKIGDQVILWQTGNQAGCYALAEVTSELGMFKEEDYENQYYLNPIDNVEIERVKIKIVKNMAENPILWIDIKENNTFSGFKGSNQGTNFTATKEEFNALLNWNQPTQNIQYTDQLIEFLEQAKTDNLKTKSYIKSYKGLSVKVSFGQGVSAKIPWISFLKDPFTTSNGIYPVYLLYKKSGKLILAYGISETIEPETKWNLDSPISIKDYFIENKIDSPERYGKSYIYKVYDVNNLPNNDELSNDLNNIIMEYSSITKDKIMNISTNVQINFDIKKLAVAIKDCGLLFSNSLLTRFVSSLTTKPFVLLTGLSGSGKTKLAQSFAQWISEDKSQYCIVPVGADWTNREPLLGYVNALDTNEYVVPENGALELMIRANEDQDKPYFLILDEMNLSHVERYFADFLSVMESNDKFRLHNDKDDTKSDVPNELSWPKNLFVVGTVNIDETTYMFSPKVLDRANVIEFKVDTSEIEQFLKSPSEIDLTQLENQGCSMGHSFVDIAKNKEFKNNSPEQLNTTLVEFFKELKKAGAEFGYRTGMEINRLYLQLTEINTGLSEPDKIDIAIMQKLLPKLHGSRRKLCPILEILANLCVKAEVKVKDEFLDNQKDLVFTDKSKVKYTLSLEKITRMYKGAIDNGFTSYAEA